MIRVPALGRLRRFVAARVDPKAYLGLHVTVSFLVCALAVWVFGALVDSVLENDTIVRLDIAAAAWIHERVTPSGTRFFELVTYLGSPLFIVLLVAAMAIWCWLRRDRILAIAAVAVSAGQALLAAVLKASIHRQRPAFGAHFLHGQSFSFPSGHAFGSIVAYGMLATLILTFSKPPRSRRRLVQTVAASIVLAIGVSRIYLGVHYPSDVIGGYMAGIAWLAICLTGIRFARARSKSRDADVVPAYAK